MIRDSYSKRFLAPPFKLALLFAVSYTVHHYSHKIPIPWLHNGLSHASGILAFICLIFGPLYVYSKSYFRGASPLERFVAAFFTPMAWAVKEVVFMTSVYSLFESLYYLVSPVCLLVYGLTLAGIGYSELRCRSRMRRKGERVRGARWPSYTAIVVGLGFFAGMIVLDLGVHHFYLFQTGYKYLFGYGLGM